MVWIFEKILWKKNRATMKIVALFMLGFQGILKG